MLFEVFIPARERDGFDETLTIEADNWMIALKSGLRRIGEDDMDLRSLMCDIKEDNSVYVTDAITRRVFILRELDARADETIALRKIREQSEERAARAAAAARAAEAPAAASRREAASRGQRPAGGTREAS